MINKTGPLLSEDLHYILDNTRPLWEALRDQRIFITGGTGFFGSWLLESFLWANKQLKLNASAVVLTRDVMKFSKKSPHLCLDPSLIFHEGDIRDFEFPSGTFSHIIHAATEACVSLNKHNPKLMLDTIVQGTKRTLEFAIQCGASNFLLTSSGAVYGKQPDHLHHIPEDYLDEALSLGDVNSAYADGKRESEQLCAYYAEQCNLNIKIARCFAFVGPHLPLDTHFAIGNFIGDALKGNVIKVKSDGTPYRSYLYAADLAIWLWTILFKGATMRAYNVGSDESISIKNLAYTIGAMFDPKIEVQVEQIATRKVTERYVPDISRARDELNLTKHIDLRQAIKLTKEWYIK